MNIQHFMSSIKIPNCPVIKYLFKLRLFYVEHYFPSTEVFACYFFHEIISLGENNIIFYDINRR